MRFYINGTLIKNPVYSHETYDITKANRLANGNMSMQLIATKQKFLLTYPAITAVELRKILNLLSASKPFFKVSVNEDGILSSYICYVGAIKRSPHMAFENGQWTWKDVTMDFIER